MILLTLGKSQCLCFRWYFLAHFAGNNQQKVSHLEAASLQRDSLLKIKGLGISQVPAALAYFSCLVGHFKASRVSLGKGVRVGHFWTKKLWS